LVWALVYRDDNFWSVKMDRFIQLLWVILLLMWMLHTEERITVLERGMDAAIASVVMQDD